MNEQKKHGHGYLSTSEWLWQTFFIFDIVSDVIFLDEGKIPYRAKLFITKFAACCEYKSIFKGKLFSEGWRFNFGLGIFTLFPRFVDDKLHCFRKGTQGNSSPSFLLSV